MRILVALILHVGWDGAVIGQVFPAVHSVLNGFPVRTSSVLNCGTSNPTAVVIKNGLTFYAYQISAGVYRVSSMNAAGVCTNILGGGGSGANSGSGPSLRLDDVVNMYSFSTSDNIIYVLTITRSWTVDVVTKYASRVANIVGATAMSVIGTYEYYLVGNVVRRIKSSPPSTDDVFVNSRSAVQGYTCVNIGNINDQSGQCYRKCDALDLHVNALSDMVTDGTYLYLSDFGNARILRVDQSRSVKTLYYGVPIDLLTMGLVKNPIQLVNTSAVSNVMIMYTYQGSNVYGFDLSSYKSFLLGTFAQLNINNIPLPVPIAGNRITAGYLDQHGGLVVIGTATSTNVFANDGRGCTVDRRNTYRNIYLHFDKDAEKDENPCSDEVSNSYSHHHTNKNQESAGNKGTDPHCRSNSYSNPYTDCHSYSHLERFKISFCNLNTDFQCNSN